MGNLEIVKDDAHETSPEDVAAFLAATSLIDVRVDEVVTGPVQFISESVDARLVVGSPKIAYSDTDDELLVRLEHTLECSADGNAVTNIQVFHIIRLGVAAPLKVDIGTIFAWVQTNAYFMAYPYVRHFFTSMTSLMGLPPVVLGYLSRDEWPEFGDEEE